MRERLKWLVLLLPSADSLKCFQCTKHSGSKEIACPSALSSISTWSSDKEKYYDVGSSANFSCSVRVGGDGVIYHQGGIPRASCNNSDTIAHIKTLINTDSGTTGARYEDTILLSKQTIAQWKIVSKKNCFPKHNFPQK